MVLVGLNIIQDRGGLSVETKPVKAPLRHYPRYRLRRGTAEKVHDPDNPFTHWLKGTNLCNEEYDKEKEIKRQKIKSATHEGRKSTIPRKGWLKMTRTTQERGIFDALKTSLVR